MFPIMTNCKCSVILVSLLVFPIPRLTRLRLPPHFLPLTIGNCSVSGPRRLRHRPWNNLDIQDFACPPVAAARATAIVTRARPGTNITLSCHFEANPEPTIEWIWQGEPIRNVTQSEESLAHTAGLPLYVIRESGDKSKTSNLTIVGASERNDGR